MLISLACLFQLSSSPRSPGLAGPCFALHPSPGEMKALCTLPKFIEALKEPNYSDIRAEEWQLLRSWRRGERHLLSEFMSLQMFLASGIQAEASVSAFLRRDSLLGLKSCPLSWEWVTAIMVTRPLLCPLLQNVLELSVCDEDTLTPNDHLLTVLYDLSKLCLRNKTHVKFPLNPEVGVDCRP